MAAAVALVVGSTLAVSANPAEAAPAPGPVPLLVVPQVLGNPNPGTDLFASVLALGSGGTVRECGTSQLGILVRCVEHVTTLPSASPTASGVTYAHWIFCKAACTGSLFVHEMVHVAQFEQYGDLFGPLYLAEAGLHGTGCDNVYERPAYQTNGQCT